MNEMRKIHANRQINDVFNIWNDLNSILIHGLLFNSLVLIYRENKTDRSDTWKKSHKLFDIQNETTVIKLFNEFIKFKTTSVKFYYQTDLNDEQNYFENVASNSASNSANTAFVENLVNDKNSEFENIIHNEFKNIDENISAARIKHGRGRIVKYSAKINQIVFNVYFVFDDINIFQSSSQFQAFQLKKIMKLFKKKNFEIIHRKNVFTNARIFNFRFVDKIKHFDINKTFEKSRLIIQIYNDMKKNLVLTQTPTIQRISQRLVVCLAAILQNDDVQLYLQNITQMYVQLKSSFNRDFYIRSSQEFIALLKINSDCIFKIIKPLYNVFETDNHWFVTYHNHHISKLDMMQSIYDFCLLYKSDPFGIVRLQIDDTLLLADNQFADAENEVIKSTKIMIKNRECLMKTKFIKFNNILIELIPKNNLVMTFDMQMSNIFFIKNLETLTISNRNIIHTELTFKNQYVAHWTKNVYIVSICQFETSFDLFSAV